MWNLEDLALVACTEVDGPVGRCQDTADGESASMEEDYKQIWPFMFSKCWKNGCVSMDSVFLI